MASAGGGANAAGVVALLDQLRAKLKTLEGDIDGDRSKKAAHERKMVGLTDSLEDLEALLGKQRKLLRKYNNQLDEAEQSIKNLARQSGKFEASYHRINKSDGNVKMASSA